MTIIDLLITIIIVTILVTIALGVMTYIAYKLRLARRPSLPEDAGARYFVVYEPPVDVAEPAEADAT